MRSAGHRAVGHLVAESHALAALAKNAGLQMKCACAFEHTELEWYHDFWEAWKGQLKSIRGRMGKVIPILGRPMPRPIVAFAATAFVHWQLLPWGLFLMQISKFINGLGSFDHEADAYLLFACAGSIACSYLNRLMGRVLLGYESRYWWMAPVTSSVLMACMAVRACRPDSSGRWADGTTPEGFKLPCEAESAQAAERTRPKRH